MKVGLSRSRRPQALGNRAGVWPNFTLLLPIPDELRPDASDPTHHEVLLRGGKQRAGDVVFRNVRLEWVPFTICRACLRRRLGSALAGWRGNAVLLEVAVKSCTILTTTPNAEALGCILPVGGKLKTEFWLASSSARIFAG
jgi:hypothetical protein